MTTQNGTANSVSGATYDMKDSLVFGQTSQGTEIHATLLRFTRFLAAFEIYSPTLILRTSEVLSDFRIVLRDRTIYSGRAVIRTLVSTGLATICEATLNEDSWMDVEFTSEMLSDGRLENEFTGFVQEWQKHYRVVPEFKVVTADMQSYLSDLRLWLEQIELEIRSSPSLDRSQLERDVIGKLADPIVRSIDAFIERFESIAGNLEPDLEPIHRSYLRRQLHPLILSSPFAYRAYHKPLGFAGDYEVVDMMFRPPYEGGTLFAKVMNVWLLGQAPVQAHRNRVMYLKRRLLEEAARANALRKVARVFNLGCGPAVEVQQFLQEYGSVEQMHMTLVDFSEEALQYLRGILTDMDKGRGYRAPIQLVKKTVHQILKESSKSVVRSPNEQYDFVYCAGLFDYMSTQVCKRLMNTLYDMLAPGGLLLASNLSAVMNSSHPFRYSMEYMLGWHLIYRNRQELAVLAPDKAPSDSVSVTAENTGVNVFMEVRKPTNA
jgi:extracellular factor (EF) 3-hydroxypalmitic acid methyl ester biosynthesis protein